MYENFYGLRSRPFQLTPDPHYYFESVTHRKALSYLGYGLAQGEGFIVITGDVGAGKTTLVGHLMSTIDEARLTAANIVTTKLDSRDIVRIAANNFDIETDGLDKAQLLSALEEFLHSEARAGRRCLLIVDESQNLQTDALEELRMLSNFQLGGQALLQIFLLGQPEFRDNLQQSDRLEQLRQRVIAHHHLEPMEKEEIEPYITHRLSKSGWTGRPKITSDVFRLLYSETGGVPRKINTLMSRVLLMGSVEQAELIDQNLVGRVLADLNGEEVDIAGGVPEEEIAAEPPKSPLMEKPSKKVEPELPPLASAPHDTIADTREPNVSAQSEIEPEEHEVVSLRSVATEPAETVSQVQEKAQPAQPPVVDVSEPVDQAGAASAADSSEVQALAERVAQLEARLDSQEENLQRILTMLVDWVESDVRSKEDHVNTGRAA
ncbi:MAG: XrtA/PEP-CTERM system-associated ATPase [Pseudomonadota bacterium]